MSQHHSEVDPEAPQEGKKVVGWRQNADGESFLALQSKRKLLCKETYLCQVHAKPVPGTNRYDGLAASTFTPVQKLSRIALILGFEWDGCDGFDIGEGTSVTRNCLPVS